MTQGIQGFFKMISTACNVQQAAINKALDSGQLNNSKVIAAADALDSFCGRANLQMEDQFNDQGQRVGVIYKNSQGQLVDSMTLDPTSGAKTSQCHYENGTLSRQEIYDLASGIATEVDEFNEQGQRKNVTFFDSTTGNIKEGATFDPATGKRTSNSFYDENGKLVEVGLFTNGVIAKDIKYDPVTGKECGENLYSEDGTLVEERTAFMHKEYDAKTGNLVWSSQTSEDCNTTIITKYGSNGIPIEVDSKDRSTGIGTVTYLHSNGQPAEKLTIDPDTGAVNVKAYDDSGNLLNEKNYASMNDYDSAMASAKIDKKAQDGFKFSGDC